MLGFFLKNMLIYIKDANKKRQQKGAFYIRSFVKIIKLRHLKKVFDKFYNNSYTLIKSLVDLLQTLLSTRDIYFTTNIYHLC